VFITFICSGFILILLFVLILSVYDMYYSAKQGGAKRGIAIACRLSVCLSVTLVNQDHIGWKSWKLTALTIIAQHLRSSYSPKNIHLLPGEHGEIWWRWEKVACWSTNATVSLKRIKVETKLLWRAYRNSPTLFRRPLRSPSPLP